MLSLASVWTKHPGGWLQRITGHLKVSIFVFILGILAVGSVVAQENSASRWPTSATAEGGFLSITATIEWPSTRPTNVLLIGSACSIARTTAVPVVTAYHSTLRMKIATGVSKSLSRWNFDSNG